MAAHDRKEECERIDLPEKYTKYLDTSFLGPEQSVSVGPVVYSYFRFGPLAETSNPGQLLPESRLAERHVKPGEDSLDLVRAFSMLPYLALLSSPVLSQQVVADAGRPLVMVVGLGCTKSTWTPDLLQTLAENREVIIFDNRGSGHSTDPEWPDHGSLEGYANSTVDLVHALDLEQPDILGWSMVRGSMHC